MKKIKLDELLITRGFIQSKDEAKRIIMAGKILINDQVITQPGTLCEPSCSIRIKEKKSNYVSRGGDKLESFLKKITLTIENKCAIDIGISTGGFTDVLLQNKASHVLGIDVGYGILDYKLRKKENLSLLERTNAREVTKNEINQVLLNHHINTEDINLVLMDVSFISVFKILPNLTKILSENCDYIILIKPQFEAEKEMVGFGGILSNPLHLDETLKKVKSKFKDQGFEILFDAPSDLKGAKGNQEYFYHVKQAYQP